MRKKYPQKATQKPQNYPIVDNLPTEKDILAELIKELPDLQKHLTLNKLVLIIMSVEQLKEKSENYLFKIMQKHNKDGFDVMFIIDIFWYYKKEIIMNAIRHRLRLYKEPLRKIGARQIEIKDIPASITRDFTTKYCLHGARPSSIKLGAYYKDELVAVMTYGKPLLSYNTHNVDVECHRAASKPNIVIIGLIDKVLKYLKEHYQVNSILNYKENLLYNKHDAQQSPNYIGETGLTNYYIINNVLHPRLQAMNMKDLPLPIACYDKISTPGSAVYIIKAEEDLEEMF